MAVRVDKRYSDFNATYFESFMGQILKSQC
jgi:hypothetical protein